MKNKLPIVLTIFLIFIFCIVNMAASDPVEIGLDGGIEETSELSSVQKAPKYIRSIKTQKRVKVHGVLTSEKAQIINAGNLGNIVEVQDVSKNSLCNILIVAPEGDVPYGEGTKKGPIVSNVTLTNSWGKDGNSWPVKLGTGKHPLPEFYWNVLLRGDACKLVADEPDYYLASDWKQLMALPDYVKEDIILVRVVMTRDLDGGTQDIEEEYYWGDPEIQKAKKVLYMTFPHSWAGADNTFNLVDPALLEYRKSH